jgi:hypothetical protein
MAVARRDLITDRFALAVGGHNSGDDPEFIGPEQYADSKNITNRGGRVRSRPRFVKKADLPTDPANGLYFQGITHFKSQDQIILRANGRIYRLEDAASPGANDPACEFIEVLKPNVTVWEVPTAQVDTMTVTGTGPTGAIDINIVAIVDGVAIDDTISVSWATDLSTTSDNIASAINADTELGSIVNANHEGSGVITLTSDVAGRGFISSAENNTPDLAATIETTTPNGHVYVPNELIPQGDKDSKPTPVDVVAQVDTITIIAGTNDPGVNTIDVVINGTALSPSPVNWATSNPATATALAAAINSQFGSDVTAVATGDGSLTITADIPYKTFTMMVNKGGDVSAIHAKTTPRSFPLGSIYYDWDKPMLYSYYSGIWNEMGTTALTVYIPLDANPLKEQVWFEEVAGVLVSQDGEKQPIQYDGSNWDNLTTVPVGTAMRFANGRLHLVSSGQRKTLQVGDILQNGDPTTALKFTETGYLLGGGSFAFPNEITALHEVPTQDKASGHGTMVIGTTRDCHTLRTDVTDRDAWTSVQDFQAPLLPAIGVAGPNSIVPVNNDLYFRSSNGLRSLRMAVGEQQSPGYGGLHQEIPEKFQKWGLKHNSSTHSGDRFITTVLPKLINHQWVYEGAVSINFESLNRLGGKSPVSFDGYWSLPTDHYFHQIFDVDGTCYAVVYTGSGDELWELQKDGATTVEETGLEQIIVTRAMNGQDPMGLKTLGRMDIWLSKIQDNLSIDFEYRVDNETEWRTWETLVVTLASASPTTDFIPRYTLKTPPGNKVSGYSFQFRLKWTGRCEVDYIQAYFKPLAENQFAEISTPITLT